MRLGAVESPASPPPRAQIVRQEDCTHEEPMVIGIVMGIGTPECRDGVVEAPDWAAACRVAYKALCKLYPKNAADDSLYMKGLIEPGYRPKMPFYHHASASTILFIWPKRYHEDYLRRLKEDGAASIPGYEKYTRKN